MEPTPDVGGNPVRPGPSAERFTARAMTALRFRVPARLTELAGARRVIRQWAEAVRLSPTRLDRLLLTVGEAIGNAVEHAYLGIRGGVIDIYLDLDVDGRLTGWVRDYGRWREGAAPDREMVEHRGRGLSLIRGVMDHVEVIRRENGTTIRFTDAGYGHPLWGPEPSHSDSSARR